MEKTETDRRFRNVIYGLLVLLVAAYGIYKYQMVATAFEHWDVEQISGPKGLAAK